MSLWYIMAIHLPECVQHFPPVGHPLLIMQSKIIPLKSFPMHLHTCTHTHLMKMLASCPHATQGDCTEQQCEARRWSDWCLLHSSWQRQNAKLWSATVLCKREKNWLAKRERDRGENRAIPPHSYLFHFSRHCQIFPAFSQMMNEKRPPRWDVSFSASAEFLPWLFLRAVQTWAAILPPSSHQHTSALCLSLSLSASLPLPLSLFLTQTLDAPCTHLLKTDRHSHTPRNAHTYTHRSNKWASAHYCTLPLFCAAVNVSAISEVLNQLCDAEPVNGLGKCGVLQSLCTTHIFWQPCTHAQTHIQVRAHTPFPVGSRADAAGAPSSPH